jgi:hypothetical protein
MSINLDSVLLYPQVGGSEMVAAPRRRYLGSCWRRMKCGGRDGMGWAIVQWRRLRAGDQYEHRNSAHTVARWLHAGKVHQGEWG